MNFEVCSAQLQGDRENQEDRYITRWVRDGDLIALVADGMGGHPDGELAAGVGVQTVAAEIEALLQRRDADLPAGLRAAFGAGHQAVSKLHSPGWSLQPATTLVGGVFLQERGVFHCANVGDGLSFFLHGDSIEPLARYCDLSYSLGYSLGSDTGSGVELVEPLALVPGDRILLASDGLAGFNPRVLHTCLQQRATARDACEALVRLVLDQRLIQPEPRQDNATLVVVGVCP